MRSRIARTGRRLSAKVVARGETDRRLANVSLIVITFELRDGDAVRRVVFEHVYGPRHTNRYKVGREVEGLGGSTRSGRDLPGVS